MVFQRNLAKVAAKIENGEEQSKISDALPADEFIDQVLSKIDSEAKRVGHIFKRDVQIVFDRIKRAGTVSSIQSLYLIRCCGALLCYEPPSQRVALVHEIWSNLQELGIPMDASHYNALLKCFLENQHEFSPPEFLATMEHKGIVPNRVTYQRIIEKYCHDGDLSGASAILEHMKEKDFPINESIFNNLVLGHARANDIQGAVNMLDVMRKSQLEPSSETYTALACGFAEKGDMEGFSNTLHEAEEKQQLFSSKNYLQMVLSLASSGNAEYLDEIIGKVEIRQHRAECVNTALALINRGYEDAAYRVVLAIGSNGSRRIIYDFMKALTIKQTASEKILSYCQDIYNKQLHEYVYEDVLKAMMHYGKAEDTFKLFQEMKDVGRPIRPHYFWPLLSALSKNGNVEGVWSALKFMSEMTLPVDTSTYVDYVLPHVQTSDPETIISKVKEIGQSDAVVIDALFLYHLRNSQVKAATDLWRKYKPQCSLWTITNALTNIADEDVESAVTLLKEIQKEILDSESDNDAFGMLLQQLLFQQQNFPLLKHFLAEYNIQGIKLSTVCVEALCSRLAHIAPELVRLVRNLEINVIRDQYTDVDFVRPSELNLEELEKQLDNLKATGGNIRPVLRHLLTHYCRQKNLERALQMKTELDAIDFTYSPASYTLLVNLFVSFNNVDEAMKYKKLIDEEYPHFKLEASKAIDYVALLIKCDKADEALDMIRKEARDWVTPRYTDLLVMNVKKLLHAAADTGNVAITRQLFEIFALDLKFVQMHHTTLEPLIKVHLVRNDSDAAIEEYRNCVVNYSMFPSRNTLFKKFIAMKDPERLQKVVDISTTYGGREIQLHELAAAFIESGCVQEARKVIQTLGSKTDTKQLDVICYRFFKQEKVLELEQMIDITKDSSHIDRDQLYIHLLNLYSQTNDYQAALEMWNSMQEENVNPSVSTLHRLAELLEKNNQPIPFVVPLSSELQSTATLMKYLDERNEVETVNLLRRMKKGEVHALGSDTFARIVDLLVEKKYLKEIVDIVQVMSCILAKPAITLKPVSNKYGLAGEVDSLKLLYDCLPDFAHKYMHFNSNFFEAHIVSGQQETLLAELERDTNATKNLFSSSGFLKLLQTSPELFDRAAKLVDKYYEEGFDSPKMVLWLHYFLQGKYEDADKIYKENSTIITKTDYPFVRIFQVVRNTQDEELGRKAVEISNESLKIHLKSRAYSCLLDALVHNEKLDEAVALIEEANMKGVPTDKLFHPTLLSLKKSLIKRNMPVPFVIPLEVEDSSSSGDDSD